MQILSPRFKSEQYFVYEISGEMFHRNLLRFVWRRHAGAHQDGHQHGGQKPTETSVTEFCYKSLNISLEELTNIKVIFFLIHDLFRYQNTPKHRSRSLLPKQDTFSTYMTVLSMSLGHHLRCKCRVKQKLRNSRELYRKTNDPLETKI